MEVEGHQLRLLENGAQYFPELCDDIHRAEHYVFLESYIFQADDSGALISSALLQAVARGVKVHVLLDGFGSAELPEGWIKHWVSSGILLRWFRKEITPFSLHHHQLRRLHRKLAVIDGKVAYVGGINIINDISENMPFVAPRLDYSVRITGGIVEQIDAAMRHLWAVVSLATFKKRGLKLSNLLAKTQKTHQRVRFIVRDNVRHRRDIERAYLSAIYQAKQEIILANPYFLPGRHFRLALKRAAKRGVKITLLLQGQIEYRLQHYATTALYPELINAGIQIYEYQVSFLHAKTAVFDHSIATVGSSNIDPFSLLLAREANLWVEDSEFATLLRNSLIKAISLESKQVTKQQIIQQGYWHNSLARISFTLIRLVTGLLGFKKRW